MAVQPGFVAVFGVAEGATEGPIDGAADDAADAEGSGPCGIADVRTDAAGCGVALGAGEAGGTADVQPIRSVPTTIAAGSKGREGGIYGSMIVVR